MIVDIVNLGAMDPMDVLKDVLHKAYLRLFSAFTDFPIDTLFWSLSRIYPNEAGCRIS